MGRSVAEVVVPLDLTQEPSKNTSAILQALIHRRTGGSSAMRGMLRGHQSC